MPPVVRDSSSDDPVILRRRIQELEQQLEDIKLIVSTDPDPDPEPNPEPEPEPEPEPDTIVGYYTMERKKNEDGTPKKVPQHKGPNNGLYYVNEAGNKVYGTPASQNVEMLEAAAE